MESTLCVDQDVKEDEYDALNDETFGDAGIDDAWEENHDVLAAQLEETIKSQQHNAQHIEDIVNTSISQLGLDEEVRNFASQPPAAAFTQQRSGYPPPALAGHVSAVPLPGHPVTPQSMPPQKLLSLIQGPHQAVLQARTLIRTPMIPPMVVSAEQLEKQMLEESRRSQPPAPPPPQVKTLEELESEMFLQQQGKQRTKALPAQQRQPSPPPQKNQQNLVRAHQPLPQNLPPLQQLQQQPRILRQAHPQHLQQMPHLQQFQQQQQAQQHLQLMQQIGQLDRKPLNTEPHLSNPSVLQPIADPSQAPAPNGFRQSRNPPAGAFPPPPQNFNERFSDFQNIPPAMNSAPMGSRFRFPQGHPALVSSHYQRGPDFRDQRFRDQGPRDYRRDDGRYSEQRGENWHGNAHSPNDFHERNAGRYNKRDVETFGFDAVHELQQEQETKAVPRSDDPYCGLMAEREKEFVIRVQMLSLNMQCPQEQDYYYLEFMKRKSQGKAVCRNKLLTQRIQRTVDSPREPQQFENSLGKLHSSTAHAPKKILDMAGSRKLDDGDGRTVPANTDLLLFRKLLMDTERGFSLVLKIEDPEVLTSYEEKILAAQDLVKRLGPAPEYLLGIRKGRLLVLRSIGALWRLGGHREFCIRLLFSLFDHLELILVRQRGLGDAVFIEKLDIIDDVLRECQPEDIEKLQNCMKKYEVPGNDVGQWILAGELGQMITEKLREAASRR
ncbi:protein PAT1 homolog 1 [Galendromus occidentalis]|uniref:Protein PAT1 homolog 1 n=1 Tax=Galendromus occidentalis TaxID=34638 RepID=A0AAJ6QK98_9ACAR|nr:protein PAT1 homolog 1 [Galendromus occidentalis]